MSFNGRESRRRDVRRSENPVEIADQPTNWSEADQRAHDALYNAISHHQQEQTVTARSGVQICITAHDAVDPRYEYKDGSHLLSTITESMKQEAAAIATSNGLDVIGQGDTFVSLAMADPQPETDVAVAEVILADVFGKRLRDLAGVVEACADGGDRHWLASSGCGDDRHSLDAR